MALTIGVIPSHIVSSQTRSSAIEIGSVLIRSSVFWEQRNRLVITPQSSCEPVAVYGTGRGTFGCIWWYISKHTLHCNQYYIRIFPTRQPVSDLLLCIAVCQTDTYPSAKLLLRTSETDSLWFYDSSIADRPTPDTSAARLSAIRFKTLILSIKHFAPIPY